MDTTERLQSHSHLETERASPRAPGLGLPLQTSSTTSARLQMSWCTGAEADVHLQGTAFHSQSQICSTKRRLLPRQTHFSYQAAFAKSNLRVLPLAPDGNCALCSMEVQDIFLSIVTRLPADTSRASISLKVSGGTNSGTAALAAASSLSCVIFCTSVPSVSPSA